MECMTVSDVWTSGPDADVNARLDFSRKEFVFEGAVVGGIFSNSPFRGEDRNGVFFDLSCGIDTCVRFSSCRLLPFKIN